MLARSVRDSSSAAVKCFVTLPAVSVSIGCAGARLSPSPPKDPGKVRREGVRASTFCPFVGIASPLSRRDDNGVASNHRVDAAASQRPS